MEKDRREIDRPGNWLNGKWYNDGMTEWWHDKMTEWWNDGMIEWWNDEGLINDGWMDWKNEWMVECLN